MPVAFACPACRTAYKLPAHLAASGPVRVRCARCREVFTLESGGGPADSLPTTSPRSSVGPAKPGLAPKAPAKPGSPPQAPKPPRSNGLGLEAFDERSVKADAYELGSMPDEIEHLGPTFGDEAPPGHVRPADTRRGPGLGDLAPSAARPYRRARPPASTGRRAFLVGLLGVAGLAAAGGLAAHAWRGRDWLAVLSGDPFEVRLGRHGAVSGRAGRLYVVHGTVTNLSGSPKGFFEVRARLLDGAGQTIAERTVYAGHVLAEPELKGLSRAELERRVSETVFGDGMANARVEPRGSIPFQVIFAPAPSGRQVAEVAVAVVGVKDVP